jgi:hypothetical protein
MQPLTEENHWKYQPQNQEGIQQFQSDHIEHSIRKLDRLTINPGFRYQQDIGRSPNARKWMLTVNGSQAPSKCFSTYVDRLSPSFSHSQSEKNSASITNELTRIAVWTTFSQKYDISGELQNQEEVQLFLNDLP